eukprot:319065_1
MGTKERLASIATLLMPIGLIGVLIGAILAPGIFEKSFGVQMLMNNGIKYSPFLFAAAIRDAALGIMGLIFHFKYPQALADFYLGVLFIPIGDLMIVLYYNGSFMDGICHIVGAIGTFILIILIKASQTNKLKAV